MTGTGDHSLLLVSALAGGLMIVVAAGRRVHVLAALLVGVGGAVVLPLSPLGGWLEPASLTLVDATAALAVVVAWWGGDLMVAPLALVGLGAYATAWLVGGAGFPYPMAAVVVVAGMSVVGVAAGLLARRIPRVGLTVVTLALAVALPGAVFADPRIGGVRHVVAAAPARVPLGRYLVDGDILVYYGLLLLLLVAVLTVAVLRERRMYATLRSATATGDVARVRGVDARRLRLLAITLGAVLAGLAGCADAAQAGTVRPDAFSPESSLLLTGVVLVLGRARLVSALLGAAAVGAGPLLMARYRPVGWYRPEMRGATVGTLLVLSAVVPAWVRDASATLPRRRRRTAPHAGATPPPDIRRGAVRRRPLLRRRPSLLRDRGAVEVDQAVVSTDARARR